MRPPTRRIAARRGRLDPDPQEAGMVEGLAVMFAVVAVLWAAIAGGLALSMRPRHRHR